MSRSEDGAADTPQAASNNPYQWIEDSSERLFADALSAIEHGEAGLISDAAVRRIMTAAIKLYVAKSDGEERTFRPLTGSADENITATEVLSAVAELLRAMRLGPMELGLWYRRRPDEEI
jgi:hypothetical protein